VVKVQSSASLEPHIGQKHNLRFLGAAGIHTNNSFIAVVSRRSSAEQVIDYDQRWRM
jgi:hypothetical protein